uniref:Uncharacterized protein n=1 Tax=Meloidogyne floridensis TaxID=298350 RepID=A0A915NCS5_9BILA
MINTFNKTFDLNDLKSQNYKINRGEIEIFEKHQVEEISLDNEQNDRSNYFKQHFETVIFGEILMKKSLKDIAKFFENSPNYKFEHDRLNHYKKFYVHLSSLADNIEENMELPKEWLKVEEKFLNTKHKESQQKYSDNKIEKLSVLIRINAGKVLLAYRRMKKIFKAFNFDDFVKQNCEYAETLAYTFEGKIKSEADKVVLEKIHERIVKF